MADAGANQRVGQNGAESAAAAQGDVAVAEAAAFSPTPWKRICRL
jgi:hypothetical protein